MGGVCGIGSIKGCLSPIESLSGTLSIPVGGILDCDIYDGEYTVTPSDTVQILPTANKLLKQDIVIKASSGIPEGSEMATDEDIDNLIDDIFGPDIEPSPDEPVYDSNDIATDEECVMPSTVKITTLEQLKVALQAAKTYIDNEIGGLGGLAGKSEVAYEDLAAALKTLIDGKAEQTTVDTMIGDDTGKSIRAISAEEVAKIVAGADENYNTLKEIADWIMSDTTGAAKMANDITRLDTILDGIGDTTAGEQATVVAYVQAMIDALGIGDYVKTTVMTTELAKKVDKVEGSRLMTTAEGTKLAGIAEGAQVNVIEKIKVNGVEQTVTEKAVDVSVPTGALASLDEVTEENLDSALKAKVNAAAEGNHSHANKTVLDGITSEKVAAWDAAEQNAKNYVNGLVASNDEVTAICTEVFGTASA